MNRTDGTNRMDGTDLVLCISAQEGVAVPDEIQFLPPGTRTVTAWKLDGKGGRAPAKITVQVNEETARLLQTDMESMRKDGHKLQLDFNHQPGRASAWVESLRWAGDDPVNGGVRLKVQWTGSGRRALEDGDYKMFSPAFYPDASGRIVGTQVRMGGLVNDPAFPGLQIVAADATQHERSDMDTSGAQTAAEAENAELKKRIAELEAAASEQRKSHARSLVQAACAAGKLPAKATELQGLWEAQITKDPDAGKLLDLMPVREVPARLIQASAADRGAVTPEVDKGAAQKAAVSEYQASHAGCSFDAAWRAVKGAKPELFKVEG